jgi:hypothetical protein
MGYPLIAGMILTVHLKNCSKLATGTP